jgi:hypothetical protein
MDARRFAAGIVPVWLAAATLGAAEAGAPGVATDSPPGLLRCFEIAYEGRDAGTYARLFTTDFRFRFGDREQQARYPDGWSRTDEVASARHLFEGFRDASGTYRPPAQRIELTLTPCAMHADPEKPDSAAWYQVVVVPRVRLAIWTEGGDYLVEDDRHDFHVVRGDAARLEADQPADLDHWYIRGWDEILGGGDPDGVAGAAPAEVPPHEVGLPAERPQVAAGLPARLALEGVRPNPARGAVTVVFTLAGDGPAHLALFDIAGRVRLRRDLGSGAPGRREVVWNLGRELAPGVYWVRLSEAGRDATRRVVLAP